MSSRHPTPSQLNSVCQVAMKVAETIEGYAPGMQPSLATVSPLIAELRSLEAEILDQSPKTSTCIFVDGDQVRYRFSGWSQSVFDATKTVVLAIENLDSGEIRRAVSVVRRFSGSGRQQHPRWSLAPCNLD